LPSTHFAGSISVAERIWREVAARSWTPPADSAHVQVTLSMGIALYPSRDVRAKDGLLKAAENALHRAKRDGMNRICVFQQENLLFSPAMSTAPRSDGGAGGSLGAAPPPASASAGPTSTRALGTAPRKGKDS
jgi:two-component system cell cycle response regulator